MSRNRLRHRLRSGLEHEPDLSQYDDVEQDPLPDVTAAAIADYHAFTGLVIDAPLARALVAEELIGEGWRRAQLDRPPTRPTTAMRATIRESIRIILAKEDPLGLVGLGAEAQAPYHREASWWADRIYGDETGPESFARRMTMCFDPNAPLSLEPRPEPVYARLADRLYHEVSLPLRAMLAHARLEWKKHHQDPPGE